MEHVCGFEGCVKPYKYDPLLICSGCRVVRYCDAGCQKAAWKGHKAACRAGAAELSRAQLMPVGTVRAVPEDVLQADIAKLRVLAAQGNADAEFGLGERYETGNGVPQDDKAAAEWNLKAARQGHAHAQYTIGFCYDQCLGIAQDHKAAIEWLLKAARQGHAAAQTNTGASYERGKGVEQDHDQAMAWYLTAAQQGDAGAQFNAARYFQQGLGGVAVDHKAALDCTSRRLVKAWRMRSATLDSTLTRAWEPRRTSNRLSSGTKAARQGYAIAEFNLAVMYSRGEGVPQDRKQALAYYLKAAQHVEPPTLARAQYNLGECFERGWGTAVDLKAARNWYAKAAAQGEEEGRAALVRLNA